MRDVQAWTMKSCCVWLFCSGENDTRRVVLQYRFLIVRTRTWANDSLRGSMSDTNTDCDLRWATITPMLPHDAPERAGDPARRVARKKKPSALGAPTKTPWPVGWHYLSDATCLMRPNLLMLVCAWTPSPQPSITDARHLGVHASSPMPNVA